MAMSTSCVQKDRDFCHRAGNGDRTLCRLWRAESLLPAVAKLPRGSRGLRMTIRSESLACRRVERLVPWCCSDSMMVLSVAQRLLVRDDRCLVPQAVAVANCCSLPT